MAKTEWRRGEALDDETQKRLRELIKAHGDATASNLLGVSRASVMKAAAGGSVRGVTAIALKARLGELEKKTGT